MSIPIEIKRFDGVIESTIATIKPDTSSSLTKKLLGDNSATLSFELNGMYNFSINDYATILGEVYYITKAPVITKKSRFNYQYSIYLESRQHKLRNAQYLFFNATNELGESDFSLTGNADDFMNLLIRNANRIGGDWVKGGVITSGYKTLTFSKEDCLSALSKIASEFETEFYISGNTIHLARRQQVSSHTFMYGRNMGLYSITRELEDEVVITRLYVYGGSNNIPNTYRNFSPRLLMNSTDNCLVTDLWCVVTDNAPLLTKTYEFTYTPPASVDITSIVIEYRLAGSADSWLTVSGSVIGPRSITIPNGDYEFRFRSIGGTCNDSITDVVHITETTSQFLLQKISVIEKNISKYGTIEGTLIVEDIYPQREGIVTAADVTNFYKFKDVTLGFDINNQLLPGLAAKVVFNTGQLAGYKFEISNFNNSTKEFTILKNKDEKALDIPSSMFRPAIGDKYILIDMLMPQSYITEAELKLRAKGIDYLNTKCEPSFKYTVTCDPAYFRKKNITLEIGDSVRIVDTELQVDKQIRIVSLTRSLIDEYEYVFELGENMNLGTIASLQSAQTINNTQINNTTTAYNNNALLNGTYIGTLKIEQGTINIKDIPVAPSTSSMKKLWIDADGKVWKEA